MKRYREDIVEAKQKRNSIDAHLAEFEKRLRMQLLKEKLAELESRDRVKDSFNQGAMPQIHVTVGALAASKSSAPSFGD